MRKGPRGAIDAGAETVLRVIWASIYTIKKGFDRRYALRIDSASSFTVYFVGFETVSDVGCIKARVKFETVKTCICCLFSEELERFAVRGPERT